LKDEAKALFSDRTAVHVNTTKDARPFIPGVAAVEFKGRPCSCWSLLLKTRTPPCRALDIVSEAGWLQQ
jgi:hypothetical protein